MEVNPQIFKAYDIRGIYPEDLNEAMTYDIGRAFVNFLTKTSPKKTDGLKIIVGRDNRLSGSALYKALVRGLTEGGADVSDIGTVVTPLFYFSVVKHGGDGGVMITASHNPKEYNGLKLVSQKAVPVSENSGLGEIKSIIESTVSWPKKPRGKITLLKNKVISDYLAFNLKGERINDWRNLKIVIDTANAVPGTVISVLSKELPCKIIHLFKKSDGSFPNHPPDPLKEENLKALQKEVLAQRADLGVALDGDGDRIFFVDEKGAALSTNLITAFLSQLILADNPGAKIIYDVRSSKIIAETVKKAGGVPVVWKIGHSFMKEKMRQDNILFGAELSGHYYHKNHYFCEAPFFVLFSLLTEISKKPLSELLKPYQKYFHSGEINFAAKDKSALMARIKSRYSDGQILGIDGLRVDYKDWWFLVRPSNTEPVLRLVVEADTKELLEQKKRELVALIKS